MKDLKSDSIDETEKEKTRYAPDGGWGWLIVLAVFVNHIIFDGSLFICGVFYVEFLNYFQASKGVTSWIGSLASGMCHLPGIFTSIMINKFGCRVTAMTGAFLSTTGFIISIFATDVYFLYFSFGALVGLGFSFMYLSSIVSLGYYFNKRLSLATGLAVCGSGVGTFIMAPLAQWLIDRFDWKGAILILAGIVANGLVCGATYAPVHAPTDKDDQEPKRNEPESYELKNTSNAENETLMTSGDNHKQIRKSATNLLTPRSDYTFSSNMSIVFIRDVNDKSADDNCESSPESSEPRTKKKIFNFAVLKDPAFLLFGFHEVLAMIGYLTPFLFMPDYALTKDISMQNAAFLISIIGITNTVARVVLGFACDLPVLRPYRLHVFASLLIVPGIVCALIGFCETYVMLVLCAVAYGLALARFALTSTILIDLFSLDKLTDIMGIRSVMLGVTGLLSPPISGWIFDVTGSYTVSFIIGGVVTSLSGCVMLLILVHKRLVKKMKI